jgi:hypothetical protein
MVAIMRSAIRRLVPLLLVALSASSSLADRAVTVIGNSKGAELEAVTTAVREAVERASWTVVPHKLPPERIAEVIQCSVNSDSRCVGQLLDEVGADRLIALKLADEKYHDQPVRVVYGAVLRRGTDVLASSQRHCESCRNDLLADHVRSLVTDLVRDARRKVNPATLVIRSIPSRARVKIDGEAVGPTDLETPIAAGVHTLEIALNDYQTHTQEITVTDGQRLMVDVELVPLNGEPSTGSGPVRPPRKWRLGPWATIGAGGALALGGGILMALDEDEVQHGTVTPDYRDTMTGGLVLAATGAVAITAGIVWLTRARKKPKIAPGINYQNGPRIGIVGRF